MTKNYDANGNAILGLSGDVDSVTASIKRLVDQQTNLAKLDMKKSLEEFVNGSDEADGFFSVIEGTKDKISKKNSELEKLDKYYKAIINGEKLELDASGNLDFLNTIEDSLGLSNEDVDGALDKMSTVETMVSEIVSGTTHFYDFSKLGLKDNDKNNITKFYETFRKSLTDEIELTKNELKTNNGTMSSMMMTWVTDTPLYQNNTNEAFRQAIETMVYSIQWSDFDIENNDLEGAQKLIQQLVLTPLSSACENPDAKLNVTNALSQLFTFDFSKLNYQEANEQIKNFLTIIMDAINKDLPDDQKKSLIDMYDMFNLGKYDEATVKMKNSLETLSGGDDEELQKLQNFTKGFTTAQTETWLSAVVGAKNADEAIQKYNKTLEHPKEHNKKNTKFTKKSWNAISNLEDGENGENRSIKEAQTSLQSLAEQGKLTVEAFNKTPGHDDILTYFGLEADEAVKKINGLIEDTKQLDAMRAGITNITSHKYRNKTKAVL